jgi:hypothetical protein
MIHTPEKLRNLFRIYGDIIDAIEASNMEKKYKDMSISFVSLAIDKLEFERIMGKWAETDEKV